MANLFDSIDPEVFKSYIFWSAVLVIKMMLMSVLTGSQRHKKHAFANPEDAKTVKGGKLNTNDPDVERVRRAHLNDLENITPFLAIGFLYLLTGPSATVAINLFRLVGISRIVHTLVYAVFVIPQPARGIAWMLAYGSTLYMAVKTALAFL
ncbi:microsomal glutathione S-transferase 1-like [Uranotaenia lowii]|uniref:microsomal glutathione S-transferase 1-like n=1 Tax=Uranotaenia lowii TaxID=190385 RepID=UPI002478972D|nr:microsomal glutathione S-transferase 1-like [Uranotaenia lowii]XP_055599840.1 microsomal glutathione S-transferase 1-like [Uranotaenia lowii]